MRTFLRILALLLTIVVVVLIPLVIFSNQIGQNLFDPGTLLNLAAEKVIGPGLTIDIISNAIQKAPEALQLPPDSILVPVFHFASEQYDFYQLLFPQELQISYAAQFFENLFLWYRGSDPLPYLILDMRPFQDHLSQNSSRVIASLLQMLQI